MSNSRCRCVKCYCSYSLFEDEMKLLPTMRVGANGNIKKKVVLTTWVDWVEHIATHCPECRYSRPPKDCVNDLEQMAKQYALQRKWQGLPVSGEEESDNV